MLYPNHSHPYNQHSGDMQYPDLNHHRLADSAAESRTVLYPSHLHPHPLFTRQENYRSLDPYNSPPQQQNWHPYDSYPQNYSYAAHYPSPSPFPAPRLSPPPPPPLPPIHHTPTVHFKSAQNTSSTSPQNQRLALAGSLDPSTGIFYRTPEHPRLRTAQACEKCRTRKAKCSGEHPACKRCLTRGLVCEYAKEGRVRGPNKAKSKSLNSGIDSSTNNTSANIRNGHSRTGPRGRTSSANSSVGSSDHPDPPGPKKSLIKREQEAGLRRSVDSLSLGNHRSSCPRPPDLPLGSAPGVLYRFSTEDDFTESGFPPFQHRQPQTEYGQQVQVVDSLQVRSMHQPQMSSYHQQHFPYQLHREHQMHLQKHMGGAIQAHSQGRSTPSSSSPQKRLLQGIHTQPDHLMTLGLPYSVSPLQSPAISEDHLMYSPYLQQQHHPFPQYPVSRSTVISTPNNNCSSPHTSANGSSTSTIDSPLVTPASAAASFLISPSTATATATSTSRMGVKMDMDMDMDMDMASVVDPALHGSRNASGGGGSVSIPIEPVWMDHLGQMNAYPPANSSSEMC